MSELLQSPRPSPISLRLSPSQRDELVRRARGRPLGEFIKAELFGDGGQAPVTTPPVPSAERQLLARILAWFGESQIGQSLSGLFHAAALGSLVIDEETQTRLENACNDIVQIRTLLMQALGKQVERPNHPDWAPILDDQRRPVPAEDIT